MRKTCCRVRRDRRGRVDGLGAHVGRLAQVPARQRDDLAGHRGREQHGLPVGGRELQNALDVRQEAQVEHLVRLVKDEGAHVAQAQVTLPDQVEQPAGRADDDVDAGAQRLDLRLVGAAAVERQHARAQAGAGHPQVAGDLDRQFPGGHDHQGARRLGGGGRAVLQPLQQRDTEAERLAGAGPRLADDVVATQRDRQGQGLDRKGGVNSRGLEGRADRVRNAEFTERNHVRGVRAPLGGGVEQDRAAGTVTGGVRILRCPLPGQCFAGQGFQPPSIPLCPPAYRAGRAKVGRLPPRR